METVETQEVKTPETENKVENKVETPTTEKTVENGNGAETKTSEPYKTFTSKEKRDGYLEACRDFEVAESLVKVKVTIEIEQ